MRIRHPHVAHEARIAERTVGLNATCAACGELVGYACREHFVARIEKLEASLEWALRIIDHDLPPFPDATGDDGEAMSQAYFASNMREARALLPNSDHRNEGEKT